MPIYSAQQNNNNKKVYKFLKLLDSSQPVFPGCCRGRGELGNWVVVYVARSAQ